MELIQVLALLLGNKNIEIAGVRNKSMVFVDQFGKKYML